MAHELATKANGAASMAYLDAEGTPWHNLGQAMRAGAPIEEWIEAAGFDFTIRRAKVRYPVTSAECDTPDAWRTMESRHVLVHSRTGDALGVVSADYKVVQPAAVMAFMRELTEAAGFEIATAGILFAGKRMWALANIGEEAVIADSRDKMQGKLLISTACDGTLATTAQYTTVRVVCNNTLGLAHSRGAPKVKVYHSTHFDRSKALQDLGVTEARTAFRDAMDQFRTLADIKLAPVDVVKLTAELIVPGFADMDKPDQAKALKMAPVQRIGELALNDGMARGDRLAGVHGTAWGWVNAVTEYVDHSARARSVDNRLNSAWFGKGADMKQEAVESATRYVTGLDRTRAKAATLGAAPDGASVLNSILASV